MVKIHSVILIVCFLVFVALLAFPAPPALLISVLFLIFLYRRDGGEHFSAALMMLRRMRWFLFSILIVYCWFTPGEPLVQSTAVDSWLPTYEGMISGIQRIIALAIVIASVSLLLRSLSRQQLLAAIHFLARPLQIIGVKPETVALRMILVFDAMSEVQAMMSHYLPEKGRAPRQLDRIGGLAADIFRAVVIRAKQAPPHEVALPAIDAPPVIQWSYPLALWGCFYLSGMWWPW